MNALKSRVVVVTVASQDNAPFFLVKGGHILLGFDLATGGAEPPTQRQESKRHREVNLLAAWGKL
jgi:hypothetical protein